MPLNIEACSPPLAGSCPTVPTSARTCGAGCSNLGASGPVCGGVSTTLWGEAARYGNLLTIPSGALVAAPISIYAALRFARR